MVTYADSSFIVSLLVKDGNSATANSFLVRHPGTVSVTTFSKGETQHAIRTMVFKKQIAPSEMYRALVQFEQDEGEGFFQSTALDWNLLFQKTAQLSHRRAPEAGVRFLDMLHVASALLINANRFLTFDLRQRKFAQATGLHVEMS